MRTGAGKTAALAAIALAAAAVAACGGGDDRPGPASRSATSVRLAGCWMTVHLFRTPAARLRRFVPAGYRIGDYFSPREATLAVWALACDRAGARPAVLSLVGVQVAPPGSPPGEESGPASFHHYLLAADTDSPALRRALRAGGQPVRLVPGLALTRGAGARVVNPAAKGGFVAAVRARQLDRRHSHANVFWFGNAAFELRFAAANDRYCLRSGRGCHATVTAPRGSRLWRLLGSRTPAHATTAFDHLRIRAGTLVVHPPGDTPRENRTPASSVKGSRANRYTMGARGSV